MEHVSVLSQRRKLASKVELSVSSGTQLIGSLRFEDIFRLQPYYHPKFETTLKFSFYLFVLAYVNDS